MHNPKFSIITISKNQGNFIEDCIKSVIRQKYNNFEYIIIDAESEDQTLGILKKYNKLDPRISFISEKDNGPASGLNKGFKLATGDIFYFINADDYLYDNALEFIAEKFKSNLSLEIILAAGTMVDKNKNKIKYFSSSYQTNFLISQNATTFFQPGMFFKSKIFKEIGGFNETNKICWDGELILDFVNKKYKILRLFDPVAAFRFHNESISFNLMGSKKLKYYYDNELKQKLKYKKIDIKILRYLFKFFLDPKYFFHQFLNNVIKK